MKLNKLLTLILMGVMLTVLMSGCSSSDDGDTSDTNTSVKTEASSEAQQEQTEAQELIVSWWGNQTRNERTQQVIDQYVQLNPGLSMDGQFAEWADYWNKLSTASAGHMLPDVVQMDYKYLEQYVNNNLLVDLTPYIESGVLDISNIADSTIASGEMNGGIYAIPLGVNAPALMYNKILLDENGIVIKDNMSMEEFVDICKEVYEKTGYKTDVAYGNGDIFIEYMMRSMGAVLYEEGQLGATQDQLEEFFSVYEQGIAEGWMCSPEIYTERTIGTPEQMPLVYGSDPSTMSWCAFTYSNALTALQNAATEGTEIAMTTWPADNPTEANYLKPSMFFAVSVDSIYPETAAAFIDYWSNSTEANDVLLAERGVPVSKTISEAMRIKIDDNNKKVFDYIGNVVTDNSSAINPPAPRGSAEVSNMIDQLVEAIAYQQVTVEEAISELFGQGNSLLAK